MTEFDSELSVLPAIKEEFDVEEKDVPTVEKKTKPKPKADKKESIFVDEKPTKKKEIPTTVALFSERNVFWQEVGRLKAGYNIVSTEDAEKWVKVRGIRIAEPEEIQFKAKM